MNEFFSKSISLLLARNRKRIRIRLRIRHRIWHRHRHRLRISNNLLDLTSKPAQPKTAFGSLFFFLGFGKISRISFCALRQVVLVWPHVIWLYMVFSHCLLCRGRDHHNRPEETLLMIFYLFAVIYCARPSWSALSRRASRL